MVLERTRNSFFYLIGLAAIAFYCFNIYQNTYNIPKWDDFPEILQFLDRWLSANSAWEKYQAFISQTNEHILLVNHLIVLGQYCLLGHLNFSGLIFVGNIFYVGSALVLWLFFKAHKDSAYVFAILMLLCVSFYPYDSTLWAMTAISNQAVLFFALLAIYFVSRPISSIIPTAIFSCLAIFSQSNGFFILPVIGLYLYSFGDRKKFTLWVIFSIANIVLYFHWFNPASQQHISLLSALQQIPGKNYLLTLPLFLSYFGASLFSALTPLTFIVSFIFGTAIFIYSAATFTKKRYTHSITLVLAFLLLSVASIVAYRGLITGPEVIFVSRYKMYGAYFLACAVVLSPSLFLKNQQSTTWQISTLVLSLIFFGWGFAANLPQAKLINGDLYKSMQLWVEDGDLRRAKGFFVKDADTRLFAALNNKTYTPLVLLPQEKIIANVSAVADCAEQDNNMLINTTQLSITHQNPNAAAIKIVSNFNSNTVVSVKLCSAQKNYQFDFIDASTQGAMDEHFIAREKIEPGVYGVFVKSGGETYKLETPFQNKKSTR